MSSSYTANRTEVESAVSAALNLGTTVAYFIDTRDAMAMSTGSAAMETRAQQGRAAKRPFDGTVADVYDTIAGQHTVSPSSLNTRGWSWFSNTRCKYVGLIAYMGALYVTDRNYQLINLADLRRQT